MKSIYLLLASALLNLLLLTRLALPHGAVGSAHVCAPAAAAATPLPVATDLSTERPTASTREITRSPNPFRWGQLESEDYAEYRDRLRAIGCPENTIRDILEADFRATLGGSCAAPAYWSGPSRERAETIRLRQRETAVRHFLERLGLPVSLAAGSGGGEGADFSFLAPAKRDRLAALEERYRAKLEARDAQAGALTAEDDLEYYHRLDGEREAELRALVTAHEFFEYQLRRSPLADSLRAEALDVFETTEDEFRAIYWVESQVQERASKSATMDLEKWRHDELSKAIGEERASAFLRAQQPGYLDAVSFGRRHGLPLGTAGALHDIRRDFQARLADLPAGAEVTAAGRDQLTRQLLLQARPRVEQAIGMAAPGLQSDVASWLVGEN